MARHIAAHVVLGLGTGICVLGCLGVLVARDAWDRLHYAGPAAMLAPSLIAIAVIVDNATLEQASIKAIVVAVLLGLTSPVLVHATARAMRLRIRRLRRDALEAIEEEGEE
jgi:monovalent cation/proton antiporter MnhG/PhaG subunit